MNCRAHRSRRERHSTISIVYLLAQRKLSTRFAVGTSFANNYDMILESSRSFLRSSSVATFSSLGLNTERFFTRPQNFTISSTLISPDDFRSRCTFNFSLKADLAQRDFFQLPYFFKYVENFKTAFARVVIYMLIVRRLGLRQIFAKDMYSAHNETVAFFLRDDGDDGWMQIFPLHKTLLIKL